MFVEPCWLSAKALWIIYHMPRALGGCWEGKQYGVIKTPQLCKDERQWRPTHSPGFFLWHVWERLKDKHYLPGQSLNKARLSQASGVDSWVRAISKEVWSPKMLTDLLSAEFKHSNRCASVTLRQGSRQTFSLVVLVLLTFLTSCICTFGQIFFFLFLSVWPISIFNNLLLDSRDRFHILC